MVVIWRQPAHGIRSTAILFVEELPRFLRIGHGHAQFCQRGFELAQPTNPLSSSSMRISTAPCTEAEAR
jgi:hypothetical protein